MRKAVESDLTGRTTEKTRDLINSIDGQIKIKTNLKELLRERGITQAELVEITGIGKNLISGFVNNREGVKVGYAHIYAIMIALRITDISEFLYVEYSDEIKEQFDKERAVWLDTKNPPPEIRKLYF